MSRTPILVLCTILAIAGGVAGWMYSAGWFAGQGGTFALLNDRELEQYRQNPPQAYRELIVTKTSGPTISVASPSGFALKSPVDFDIRVKPRGGVAVDMGSLRIEYKLGPIWVNLTRRVMREARINGLRFSARGAELPPGNHALRLTVRDTLQRTTQALVKFSVK